MADFIECKLEAAIADIKKLLPEQWAETGDAEIPCEPNWNLYAGVEAKGGLQLTMAYEHGHPVGYMAAFLYPHPNSVNQKIASIQTYFVAQRHWRAGTLKAMFKHAITLARGKGAFKIDIETSANAPANRLIEAMGFNLAKLGYSMRLQDEPAEASRA